MNGFKENIGNVPKGVKASVAFFFASLMTTGIAYISTPIYTRLLSTEEYGQTAVFLTWLHIFGVIAMFCLSYGVFNNGMIDYPKKRDEYSFSMLFLSNIITVLFFIIILFLYPIIKNILGLDIQYVILMCVIFLTQPAYNFWVARQRYEYKYKYTVIWAVLSAIVSPCIAIFCILITNGSKYYARIFGAEIPLIIFYLFFCFHIAKKSKFKVKKKYWKAALLFNLPLLPHYLSTYLLGNVDKLMISRLVGASATAFYSVAYSVASVVLIVWNAINASLVPYTYEKCKEKNYKALSSVTKPLLTVFASICFFIIMLAPEVVHMMATSDYMEAIYVIPPIVGGVFFQIQYFIYANVVYYYKKPKYVMIASVSATLLNILLNYIFISKFGYVVAGYTTLLCYMLQACIDFFAMRKVVGENIYDMKYIISLSLLVVFVAFFSNLIYNYAIIRYIMVLVILVIAFVFRKRIVSVATSLKH